MSKTIIISIERFREGKCPQEIVDFLKSFSTDVFIILDESSKIKTNQPCKETKKSKQTQGIKLLNTIGQRCILTGTFMSKSPVNAFDQLDFLKKGFFEEGMTSFAERYTVRTAVPRSRFARMVIGDKLYRTIHNMLHSVSHNKTLLNTKVEYYEAQYGVSKDSLRHIYKYKEYTPFKNLDELWERIGKTCFKISREDVSALNSEKVVKTYTFELSKKQKELYTELFNMHCTDNIAVKNALELYIRFQDICNGYEPVETGESDLERTVELVELQENPKLDLLEELIERIGDEQVLIWCSRSSLLYNAAKRLRDKGYTYGVYDGKNKQNRIEDYENFALGKLQILFANQKSAGFGLDKLGNVNYAIYLCSSYSVEEYEQSKWRIDRGYGNGTKYFFHIVADKTVEKRVMSSLELGQELMSTGNVPSSVFKLGE